MGAEGLVVEGVKEAACLPCGREGNREARGVEVGVALEAVGPRCEGECFDPSSVVEPWRLAFSGLGDTDSDVAEDVGGDVGGEGEGCHH